MLSHLALYWHSADYLHLRRYFPLLVPSFSSHLSSFKMRCNFVEERRGLSIGLLKPALSFAFRDYGLDSDRHSSCGFGPTWFSLFDAGSCGSEGRWRTRCRFDSHLSFGMRLNDHDGADLYACSMSLALLQSMICDHWGRPDSLLGCHWTVLNCCLSHHLWIGWRCFFDFWSQLAYHDCYE